MSNRINIPTFITNEDFTPARVNPRIFFYNGKIDTAEYRVSALTSPSSRFVYTQNQIPYFDHYSVVTGSFPSSDSNSLLYFNETPAYGSAPSQTLYTEYWSKYVSLLYNPRTRLISCKAVIPISEYYELELNDIIQWQGNMYHLRAINNYSLTSGECDVQLLGPIIEDTLDQ